MTQDAPATGSGAPPAPGAVGSAPGAGTPTPLTRRQLSAWRNALFVIFAISGVALSSWVSRTPVIRDMLGASTAQMGWIVFALAVGSIVGLTLSTPALTRFGPGRTMTGAITVGALGIVITGVGASTLQSPLPVVLGLALLGAGMGMTDVSMNVDGAANERALGRTVMPLFHAAFSLGTMAGAGLGALAELADVPVSVHLTVIGVAMVVTILISVRYLQPHPDLPPADSPESAAVPHGWRARLAIWRDRRTVLIGLIVLGMAFAEGSANDWLTLAMVDGHDVTNATGAFVFGLFVTAMTVGRVAGVFLLDRFGRVPVLRVSAVSAAVGLCLVIFGPNPVIAGIGVVLWGLGSALGFPVGMSAAADDPATAAGRVSAVATIGYFAFLVGPPSIGFLGEHFGLLHGLLLVLVLVAVAGMVSPAAREPKGARHGAH
ncbi:MFS transporter [Nakamurella flavida]|uniref:MFS transporter n=1 Tax=Nakamurella flavida TaxID=363630 RepID=A0A938YKR8_9ACTN|nr:MFS transporter [Nakamurella flavida]MBM9476979.1 MFS transporter [Nakamurella flavida]MDP9779924.1 MFS family permease [Nakamurella flavida]